MSNDYNINLNNDNIEIIMDAAIVGWKEIYGNPANNTALVNYIANKLLEKLDKNTPITAGTHTKITYDTNGLVTAGADLTKEDLPELNLEDIKDVTATAAEVNILDGIEVTTEELNTLKNINANVQAQLNAKQPTLTFTPEDTVNKATDLTVSNNVKYPTTKAVVDALRDKQGKLNAEELAALHSGITKDLLDQLKDKQDKLNATELAALHSGVTRDVLDNIAANKLTKNNPIEAGTHTKITYDTNGLVTGGSELEASDIPMVPVSKLIGVTASHDDLNKLTDLLVTSNELNKLSGVTNNVQTQINTLSTEIEGKASKEYVGTYVYNHAGYYLTKDNQNHAFNTHAELISAVLFYCNGKQKEPTTSDYALVLADETNDGYSVMYGYVKDDIYNEGHWIARYQFSKDTAWGQITGNILNQTDLINKFNSKQDTLTNQVNIKSIDGQTLLGSGNITIDKYTKAETTQLLNNKEDKFRVGEGLELKDGVLKNTQTSANWGKITGDIEDQEDLVEYIATHGGGGGGSVDLGLKVVNGCLCVEYEQE